MNKEFYVVPMMLEMNFAKVKKTGPALATKDDPRVTKVDRSEAAQKKA